MVDASEVSVVPVTLDTNRVYAFTVVEEPFRSITIPKLRRVQRDGQTIYDIEVCEVHKTTMEHKKVKIHYGLILPGPNEPSADTQRQSFPHHCEYSLGGCVITPDSPKTTRVYVCANCKKAYDKWKTDNEQNK